MGNASSNFYVPKDELEYKAYNKNKQFANTNICKIDFSILNKECQMAMGDPVFCSKCKGVLNCQSQLIKSENNLKKWQCEFCDTINLVQIEDEEIPKKDEITYLVKNKAQIQQQKPGQEEVKDNGNNSDISIIFCLDNSGSMGVTSQLTKPLQLKVSKTKGDELEQLKQFMEPDEYQAYKNQFMSQQNNYVSRKTCVQAAIESQIEDAQKQFPNRKIGIIVFGDDICIIGDGSKEPITVAGDKLYKYEQCLEIGQSAFQTHLQQPISQAHEQILKKFENLEEKGKTALAPALICALGMLSKAKAGSMIIMCTDGLANVGFGSLENDLEVNKSEEIYEKIGNLAKECGILISTITMKGEECNVLKLGSISLKTNGKITRVNPDTLQDEFANAFKEQVIATNVKVQLLLHKDLKFVNPDPNFIQEKDENLLSRNFGSVTLKTGCTIEYDIKDYEELKKKFFNGQNKNQNLPFQAQIYYDDKMGNQIVRVITRTQSIVQDQKKAEEGVKINIIGEHIQKTTALQALFGDASSAQQQFYDWNSYTDKLIQQNGMQKQDVQQQSNQVQLKQILDKKAKKLEEKKDKEQSHQQMKAEKKKEEQLEEEEENQGLFDLI